MTRAVILAAAILTACAPIPPVDPAAPPATVTPPVLVSTAPRPPGQEVTVTRVVDGDTFKARGPDGVIFTTRLLSIDAPELNTRTRADDAECGAEAARDALTGLLPPGTRVNLAGLPGEPAEDRYGRTLANAYVTVAGAQEPVNASLWLAGNGWAVAHLAYRTVETDRALELQRQAQEQQAGMWATCPAGAR